MAIDTQKKILTLSNKSEELRLKTIKDKWLKIQENLTDNAVDLVGQNKDIRPILESIRMLQDLLTLNKKQEKRGNQ